MTRRTHTIACQGGLDLTSPDSDIEDGQLIHALNVEPVTGGGYRRIDGYERFDGRELPSEASYWRVPCTALTTAVKSGAVVTIGTAIAVAMQDHAASETILYLASPHTIPANTAVDQGGTTVATTYAVRSASQSDFSPSSAIASSESGYSVAMSADGFTAVVGSRYDTGTIALQGTLSVYVRTDSTWSFQAELVAETPEASSEFGSTVAISSDGSIIVTGAYLEDSSGTNQGAAYVFTRSGTAWAQEQRLIASDAADSDQFGWAVTISAIGATVVIGANSEDGAGTDRGAVYTFTRSGTTWTQQQQLTASDTANIERFGNAVSLSGDGITLAVGTEAADTEGTNNGAVYIFVFDGIAWAEEQKIVTSDTANNDYLGYSVALSLNGDTLIAGAYARDGAGTDRGSVFVFTRSDTAWSQEAELTASDAANSDLFGVSITLSEDGNSAAIGAYLEDGAGTDRGAVYVFTRSATTWTEQEKIVVTDTANGDRYGVSVNMSSDAKYIVTGAYWADDGLSAVGKVYFEIMTSLAKDYEEDAATHMSSWDAAQAKWRTLIKKVPGTGDIRGVAMREGEIVAFRDNEAGTECVGYKATGTFDVETVQDLFSDNFESGSRFGFSTAISSDGTRAVIGAYLEDGAGTDRGAAYVFIQDGGIWKLEQKLTASDTADSDYFGFSVAISSDGSRIIVGALLEDGAGTDRGAAYVFTRSDTAWVEEQILVASDAAAGDNFGWSVAINADGDTLAVGAPLEDGAGTDRGAIYVSTRSGVTWTQEQKVTVDSPTSYEYLGYSVAISADGSTLVGGAYGYPATDQGTVYVFTRSGTTWTQQQQLLASDGDDEDFFGWSVDISTDGTTIIIGAYQHTFPAYQGATYVFTRSGTTWTQEQKLTASDAEDDDVLGWSVAISPDGNTVVAGARLEDGAGTSRGSTYVFTRSGTTWREEEILTSNYPIDSAFFGAAVAMSNTSIFVGVYGQTYEGNANVGTVEVFQINDGWEPITNQEYLAQQTLEPEYMTTSSFAGNATALDEDGNNLAVGAYSDSLEEDSAGSVQMYERYGAEWTETDKLSPPNIQEGALFGTSLSMANDGERLLVGAPEQDVQVSKYAYQQELTASDAADTDYFGYSVAISAEGSTAAMGAYFEDGAGTDRGAVYVYTRSGTVWTEEDILYASDTADNDEFGYSVTISSDGNTVAVGAVREDGAGTNRGAVYIFTRSGATWTEQQKLTASDTADNDFFGESVSISSDGNTVAVGADREDGTGTNRGAVYIFTRSGATWTEQQKLTASDTADNDLFGGEVALSGDGNVVVIGAIARASGGTQRGAAYVFIHVDGFWTQQGVLTASDAANNDQLGNKVTVSEDGSTIVACNAAASIKAYVYYSGANVDWVETSILSEAEAYVAALSADGSKLVCSGSSWFGSGSYRRYDVSAGVASLVFAGTSPNVEAGELFGRAIGCSTDAEYVLIGSSQRNLGGADRGAADVFTSLRTKAGTANYYTKGVLGWGLSETIDSPDLLKDDKFGTVTAISQDGTHAVIGAPYKTKNSLANAGYAYVYELDVTWQLRSTLSLDVPVANYYFGGSLAMSEDGAVVVVGQYGKTVTSAGAGSVLIYDKVQGEWTLTQTIDAPNPEVNGNFGYEVAISHDGLVIAISAPYEDTLGTDNGRVYMYELSSGTWTLRQTILLENDYSGGSNDYFGEALALNEDGSILAASQGGAASDPGKVNVFERHNNYWTPVWRFASGDNNSEEFGAGISISKKAEYIAMGAPQTNTDTGQAFVYAKSGAVLAPGGSYDFDNYNFIGPTFDKKLYGADGANYGFEYDGTIFKQIYTGMETDTPEHVFAHKQHLFFTYGPSLQHSSLGNPHEWQIITGAAEIGIAENITGFRRLQGGEAAIFGRNKTFVLYGSSTLDWQLKEFSPDTGAIPWTIQSTIAPVFLDDRGVALLQSVQSHGDFDRGTISRKVDPILSAQRGEATASTIIRDKNQYRLFFSNGLGLIFMFDDKTGLSITPIKYDVPVLKTVSEEGTAGIEQAYFGSNDGYIYRVDRGLSFDGKNIKTTFRTARSTIRSPSRKKRFFKAVIEASSDGHSEFTVTLDINYSSTLNPAEQAQTLTLEDNDGFWEDEGLDINSTSRLETELRGNGRDVSTLIQADTRLIYPFTVNTIHIDWSPRRKVN